MSQKISGSHQEVRAVGLTQLGCRPECLGNQRETTVRVADAHLVHLQVSLNGSGQAHLHQA